MIKIQFENNVTKANAETFNTMQDNIENAINDSTIILDNQVSTSSTNGIENQAITNYIDDEINNIESKIGDLSQLNTTDKSSIVNAINEILASLN